MNTDLEDAAVIHGAPIQTAIRKVTLSLMTPAILGSTLLAFTISIENFPVAQFIARPGGVDTLPTLIYRYMSMSPSRGNDAAAIAIVLVLAVALVVLLQRWYLARKDFATVSGKGSKSKLVSLGKWRTPALLAAVLYFLVSVVLPVLSLIVIATYSSPYIQTISGMAETGSFSMDRFTGIFEDRQIRSAIGNSITVSLLVAVIGTAFCFLCSYLTYRTKAPARRWIEYLAMTPLAVPAIVLGMGLLWTWLILRCPSTARSLFWSSPSSRAFCPKGSAGPVPRSCSSTLTWRMRRSCTEQVAPSGGDCHRASAEDLPAGDVRPAADAQHARTDGSAVPLHHRHPAALDRHLRRLRERPVRPGGRHRCHLHADHRRARRGIPALGP